MYNFNMLYLRRALEETLLRAGGTVPVVLLEGARAVGKSTLARTLVSEGAWGSFSSLADPTDLLAAETDLYGWLRSLPRPAVIDEAQLISDLPLAVKTLVDEWGGSGHFILTGSAAIGRSGLGGADPLTRRAQGFRLDPLTSAELNPIIVLGHPHEPVSLVDNLFDGDVAGGWQGAAADEAEMVRVLRTGGFPSYVLPTEPLTTRSLYSRVHQDVLSTLSEHVLVEERFDAFRASSILDALIRLPGGIMNASAIGQQLEMDRRTVDRYLSVLERRFLVHALPNLAARPRAQDRSRLKIHPVDTSFAAESLHRAGRGIENHREQFGELLETYVVNQLLAHKQWAELETSAFYWRDTSGRQLEVDLVLSDGEGRHVGIEVKASQTLGSKDIRGLKALSEWRTLHRGFIFYTGSKVIQLDKNIWAIPIETLTAAGPFQGEPSRKKTGSQSTTQRANAKLTPKAAPIDVAGSLFLSYSHEDDEYFDHEITKFAAELVRTYKVHYGREIQLFTDRDIKWGENWRDRLENELAENNLLLAIITPGYLGSEACRAELLDFNAAAQSVSDPKRLLSLIWIMPPGFEQADANDPVIKAVRNTQYLQGTHLKDLEPGTREYRKALEVLAARLDETISKPMAQAATTVPERVADTDLVDVMEEFEQLQMPLQLAMQGFGEAFQSVGDAFKDVAPATSQSPQALRAAFHQMSVKLSDPARHLQEASSAVAGEWARLDGIMGALTELARGAGEPVTSSLREQLLALGAQLNLPGMDQFEVQAAGLGKLSRQLRPVSEALTTGLVTVRRIQEDARAWSRTL